MYYIWSNRHRQWWGPEKSGYSSHLAKAGTYDHDTAADIQMMGLPGANIAIPCTIGGQVAGDADSVEERLDQLKRI